MSYKNLVFEKDHFSTYPEPEFFYLLSDHPAALWLKSTSTSLTASEYPDHKSKISFGILRRLMPFLNHLKLKSLKSAENCQKNYERRQA